MTNVSPPYINAVYDFLCEAFSFDELDRLFYRALDQDLRNARHEYGPSQSKPTRIHKVLEYCERHYLFDELVEEIERTRPSQFKKALSDGQFKNLSDIRASAMQADQVEKLLRRGSRVPEAGEALVRAKDRLADKCRRIHSISEYKDAHDALQKVEDTYRALHDQLYKVGQLGPLEPREWLTSANSQGALQTGILKLLEEVQGKSLGAIVDARLESLRTSGDDLQSAYNRRDEALLDETLFEIDHVIGTTTSRINDFLIGAVKELHLLDLVDELQTVHELVKAHGTGTTAGELQEDQKAITKLGRMAERLEKYREEHDAWQDLDNRLRDEQKQMETGLNVRILRRSWTRKLRADMIALCESVQPGCSLDPDSALCRLDAALGKAPEDQDGVLAAFIDCRRLATNNFVLVDRRFQRLCEALEKAGDWWRGALERV